MACVLSVQVTALIAALVPSVNNVDTTSKIIIGCTLVFSIIVTILIWANKMNLSSTQGVTVTSIVCNVYFIVLVASTLLYMAVLGEIKYIMLGEIALTWVIWFVFISVFSNIKKSLSGENIGNPESSSVVHVEEKAKESTND
jgi:hypothetical protein